METVRIALRALGAHKLRSFLTLLGVIIGVMTVVTVVAIISGLNNYISEKVFNLSPDVFVVTRFGIITSREEFLEAIKRKRIDLSDYEAVERQCGSCAMIGAQSSTNQTVKYRSEKLEGVQIIGTTANMAELNNLDLEDGRFYVDSENHHSSTVAVIGSDVKEQLFSQVDPIGRSMKIGGRTFRVIGLLRKQGSVLGQSQDTRLYIPLGAFRKVYGSRSNIALFVKPEGGVPGIARAQDDVRVVLRARRHTAFDDPDPFAIVSADALQALWKNISGTAFAVMVVVSGISLVVGGIVIANIMLVSVVERTREIGVRRAMGARKRDISRQFLTEAILLSLGGGIVGVLLGTGIAKIVSTAFPLPTLVRPSLMITGLLIATITGTIAGFLPARRAANLPPIDSLRFE